MKRYVAILLIALMAVSVISSAGVASAAKTKPTTRTLDTPKLLTPSNTAIFFPPGTVVFSWTPVKHADTYTVHYLTWDDTGAFIGEGTLTATNGATTVSLPFTSAVYWTVVWSVQASNTDQTGPWAGATSAWSDTGTFMF